MNDILFAAFHDELEKLSASKTVRLRSSPMNATLREVRLPDGTVLPELKTNPTGSLAYVDQHIPDTVRKLTPAEKRRAFYVAARKRGMARRAYPYNTGPQVTRSKAKRVVDTLKKLRP